MALQDGELISRAQPSRSRERSWPGRAQRLINAVGFLKPDALAMEAELTSLKWPAYYGLDPMEANIRFAQDYSAAYRRQFRSDVDKTTAETVAGLKIASIIFPTDKVGHRAKGGQITNVQAARQAADATGLPYEAFCKFCMQFASNRNVGRIARPNQLIPPARFRAAWDRELAAFKIDFEVAMVSQYRNERKAGRVGRPGCFGVVGAQSSICDACSDRLVCATTCKKVKAKMKEKGLRSHAEKSAQTIIERKLRKAEREKQRRAKNKAKALAASSGE